MFTALWVLLTIVSVGSSTADQTPSRAAGFDEHVLAESDGLRVVAWVRPQASLDDEDWFQIEVTNDGPDGTIKFASVEAAYEPRPRSNLLSSLTLGTPKWGIPDRDRHWRSEGHILPAGSYTTQDPGILISDDLRLRDETVRLRLTVNVVLVDGRSVVSSTPKDVAIKWIRPSSAGMARLQQQAVSFLKRLLAGEPYFLFSLRDYNRRRTLISTPEIAEAITLDLALDVLKLTQLEGGSDHEIVHWVLLPRWRNDPRTIEFYRQALAARGPQTIPDLDLHRFWDESFLEPVIRLIEATAHRKGEAGENHREAPEITLRRALSVMERHHASWQGDPTVAPRLSRAVLTFEPVPPPGEMSRWTKLLALTRDRRMMQVLRPYLTNKTHDRSAVTSSNMSGGVIPMRFSELAANAICRLLGEPIMFPERQWAPVGEGPYPEWDEWDKKIAELQRRLDTIVK
jgi:hypothetical protein